MKNESLEQLKKAMEKAESFIGFIKDPSLKGTAFNRTLDILLNSSKQIEDSPLKNAAKKKSEIKAVPEGPKKWIRDLIDEKFFKEPRALSEIVTALANVGHRLKSTDVQPYLKIFMKEKKLRREKGKGKDGKKGWQYSNW